MSTSSLWAIMFAAALGASGGAEAANPEMLAPEKIDQAVLSLPDWHGKAMQVLAHLDLTAPFRAKSQWTLVAVQDPGHFAEDSDEFLDHGPMAVCFVHAAVPDCMKSYGGSDWYDSLYELIDDRVVFAGKGETRPLLWLKICSVPGGNGNCDVRTTLYAYDAQQDHFTSVFTNDLGHNNNENARFMEAGPILGEVVVDYPTSNAPYTYWIEVYRPGQSGQYAQILKYRGHVGYGDGNTIPVIYSEMPEILRRLGYWKPGDPLPVPPDGSCPHPVLKHGVEWCG